MCQNVSGLTFLLQLQVYIGSFFLFFYILTVRILSYNAICNGDILRLPTITVHLKMVLVPLDLFLFMTCILNFISFPTYNKYAADEFENMLA